MKRPKCVRVYISLAIRFVPAFDKAVKLRAYKAIISITVIAQAQAKGVICVERIVDKHAILNVIIV